MAMTMLSAATLGRVPQSVARPAYAIDALGIGIVHLGIGAFHRAHQAIYTDDAIAETPGFAEDLERFRRKNKRYSLWGRVTYSIPKGIARRVRKP